MTKRRDIIRAIRDAAREQDLDFEVTEGSRHSIVIIDGKKVPVPRHSDVPENTTREIYKEAAEALGKDWWK
ncbi:hypothetical protein [Nocardia spumae]|uniref:hypothetical protein n=1 Tax=Nocardia spumae TaxID=2887190 RepID=UPI001D145EEF|nr:hypothetical protein [Nocardia spumae]